MNIDLRSFTFQTDFISLCWPPSPHFAWSTKQANIHGGGELTKSKLMHVSCFRYLRSFVCKVFVKSVQSTREPP